MRALCLTLNNRQRRSEALIIFRQDGEVPNSIPSTYFAILFFGTTDILLMIAKVSKMMGYKMKVLCNHT